MGHHKNMQAFDTEQMLQYRPMRHIEQPVALCRLVDARSGHGFGQSSDGESWNHEQNLIPSVSRAASISCRSRVCCEGQLLLKEDRYNRKTSVASPLVQ